MNTIAADDLTPSVTYHQVITAAYELTAKDRKVFFISCKRTLTTCALSVLKHDRKCKYMFVLHKKINVIRFKTKQGFETCSFLLRVVGVKYYILMHVSYGDIAIKHFTIIFHPQFKFHGHICILSKLHTRKWLLWNSYLPWHLCFHDICRL